MEEKEKEEEKAAGTVSRRDFLKDAGLLIGGAAVGAAAGAGITYAVVEKEVVKEVPGKEVPVTGAVEPAFEPEESRVMALAGNISEMCQVDVKNGKVIRIRPVHYDEKYTKEELAPAMWKWEARGKTLEPLMKTLPSYFQVAYKKRIYSPNRILYPLKRVDWEPGGDPAKINPQNRGKSKYKRISWDEATTIIASEVKRIQEKYGPYAILNKADSAHRERKNVLGGSGTQTLWLRATPGFTSCYRNADSWEGHYWGAEHVWGSGNRGIIMPNKNNPNDVAENCEMLVIQGGDWETTQQSGGQFSGRVMRWYQELGIKVVHIAPDVNYTNAAHPDKWIPVIANRDDALYMALVYTFLNEGIYDKAYVDTHVVGMDKISDYVMGKVDGVAKTPAWASPRCGVPEWTIKALAREWASKRTSVAMGNGGSKIRGPYSTEPSRWECVVLAMQGIGKPGRQQTQGPAIPDRKVSFSTGGATRGGGSPDSKQFIPKTLVHHAILNHSLEKPVSWYGTTRNAEPVENQFVKYTYPIPKAEGGTEIHMIYEDHACQIVCWNDGYMYLHAIRSPKIECVVIQHPWMENDCLAADIVLPALTMAEGEDFDICGKQMPAIAHYKQAIKPIGEAKSDYEIGAEIAKKLEKLGGVYAGAYAKYTDGKTTEEWIKSGFDKSGAQTYISLEKLKEKGYFPAETRPDWQQQPYGVRKFYEDPVKNPLPVPTGKIELYSARLAENFPDDKERPPYPQYVIGGPASEGWFHDESLWGERAKKYPLLLVSNHPRWRVHAQYDDVPWFREIPTCKVKGPDGYLYEPVWIHPKTAAERGIRTGDIVKIFNDRGITLGGAQVSERIMPGHIYQDHGARLDPISWEDSEYDDRATKWINRGADNNVISPAMGVSKNCWGMATSGFLVDCQKLSGNEYEEWRQKYPEAFARDYDPAYGLKFDAWIEGGT